MTLEGRLTRLRAVEPADADLLYAWENDPAVWAVSGTTEPFSRAQIERFVERQLEGGDLLRTGQLRLMIDVREAGAGTETNEGPKSGAGEEADKRQGRGTEPEPGAGERNAQPCRTVGTVDLFEYDPLNGRAGLGILIYGMQDRRQGYARDAVETLCTYARTRLRMHQLWCCVGADNEASLQLFRDAGFRETGTKSDWLWTPEGYRDEIMFQKLLE